MSKRPILLLLSVLLIPALAACDEPPPEPAQTEPKVDPIAEAAAKKKAEREAAKKAEEEAEQARLAKIAEIATLPPDAKPPKKLEKACEDVAAANDEFMNKNFEGEAIEKWNAAKGTQMGMMKTNCIKGGNMEVAMCQAHAMRTAPPELKKDLPDLLSACINKYKDGAPAAEGGEAPPAQ